MARFKGTLLCGVFLLTIALTTNAIAQEAIEAEKQQLHARKTSQATGAAGVANPAAAGVADDGNPAATAAGANPAGAAAGMPTSIPTVSTVTPTVPAAVPGAVPAAAAAMPGLTATPAQAGIRGNKMLIVSAINIDPCESFVGNYVNILALKNKEDYARLHGYGFYYAIDQQNSTLFGPWNKIKVLQMLMDKVNLAETEWLMWVDNDALFVDVKTTPPFERYEGKDFVIWGDEEKTYTKLDAHHGLNGGVLLVRVSDWSRRFLAQLADYGIDWWHPRKESPFESDMKATLGTYHRAFYEQNAIVHILHRQPELRERVFLENWEFWYFHTHYKYLPVSEWDNLQTSHSKRSSGTAYISHFAGCQFCSPSVAKMEIAECVIDFVKVFGYAYTHVQGEVREMREFPMWWLVNYFQDKMGVTGSNS